MRSTCALTGHREIPADFNKNVLYDKLEELIRAGCDTFLCGMAEGFDLLALECLIDLKEKYRLFIEACVPFADQDKHYPLSEKKKYRTLIKWCDRVTVLYGGYRSGCYLARDRYMVDCADHVLAYCIKENGGTAYTVRYATEKKIPVCLLV